MKAISIVTVAMIIGLIIGLMIPRPAPVTTEEIVQAYYESEGYKMPLRVGSVEVWFQHSGQRAQFEERVRTMDLFMFDLIEWGKFEALSPSHDGRIKAVLIMEAEGGGKGED